MVLDKLKKWFNKQKSDWEKNESSLGYSTLLLFGILLLGVYMRLLFLQTPKDFWHDEAFQWVYSQKPIMFILAGSDVHPPLYNLVAKLFLYISTDIYFLRFTSIAFSLYFLWYAFKMVKELYDVDTAYIATALLVAVPTYVYYATEFRNYSFALMLIVLQIFAFNMWLKEDTAKHRWVYIGFSLACIYTHYLTGLIIFVQLIYLILFYREKIWQSFLKVYWWMTLLAVPLGYYLSLMLPQMKSFWFKGIGFHSLISAFAYIIIPPTDRIIGLGLFMYGGLFAGLWVYRKELKPVDYQFLMYLFIPPLLMWTISMTAFQFFHPRYFIFSGIGLFILVASFLVKWSKKDAEVHQCLAVTFIWLCFIGMGDVARTNNTELLESAVFLQNYSHSNNITEFITIHESTFSQTPYKVYFPTMKTYLYTNLTREMLFTAGGSAIGADELKTDLDFVNETNLPVFFISNKPHDNQLTSIRGLYVSRIR